MASVNLYMKFDYTDADGNLYSDGSTSTAKTISIDGGEIFDRTYKITDSTETEILSCGANPETGDTISDFDFLWIESDQTGEIQLVCNEDGNFDDGTPGHEVGLVLGITSGIPIVFSTDASRNLANVNGTFNQTNYDNEIDTWEDDWTVDVIDRIEFYHTTGAEAKVRVIAIT